MQPVSLYIWGQKYQLKDKNEEPVDVTVEDTFRRVAKTLAAQEPKDQDEWEEKFFQAQMKGAIPAGRITSNAGAGKYKPATSLINCTVSRTIKDSLEDILEANKKAGITLKAGCGIGYEFSTLRPSGATVEGVGAYTSGPLSFMDIFDKMCFTVSSAGGRRGAQMATFDISHPDVLKFIKAKRADGTLRQFNLSLLITKDFMDAVIADKEWNLIFPVHKKDFDENNAYVWKEANYQIDETTAVIDERGMVAHKIYETMKARDLWNIVMESTYDYAEPGFILIDEYNRMNNNWFCETIRATNPCLTGNTVIEILYNGKTQTIDMKTFDEMWQNREFNDSVLVKSMDTITGKVEYKPVNWSMLTHKSAELLEILDDESGITIKCTPDHKVWTSNRGYVKASELTETDSLVIDKYL